MADHLSPGELEAFVLGVAAPDLEAHVAVHVAGCPGCLTRLQEEAALDRELAAVAEAAGAPSSNRPAPPRSLSRRRSLRATIAVAGLAAAAAMILSLGRDGHPEGGLSGDPEEANPAAAIAPVICADGPDQPRCVEEAHALGLVVRYPAGAGGPRLGAASHPATPWEAR